MDMEMKLALWIKATLPVAALVGFVVLAFFPALFLEKAFFGEEQLGFYYPLSAYFGRMAGAGEFSSWNGWYYGGVPVGLSQFVSRFYPPNVFLFSRLDFFDAHHWSIVLSTALGLVLTYWFGRALGWGKAPSMIFALGYFLGTTLTWLNIGTLAGHSFIVLPALYLALYKIRQGSNSSALAWILLGGIPLGIGFLAGFPQIVFYALALAGPFALFLDWEAWEKGTPWFGKFRATLSFFAVSLAGAAIGARQIVPSASFIDLTIRTGDYAIQNAYSPSIAEFFTFFLPDYVQIPFVGGGSAGFYIGALSFAFAFLSLLFYRSRLTLFFFGLYGVVLGFSFHLPGFSWLNEHLLPFSRMGGNFRWMVAAAFPLAYLAASGLQEFLRNPERLNERIRRRIFWAVAGIAAVLAASAIFARFVLLYLLGREELLLRFIEWYRGGKPSLFSAGHYLAVLKQTMEMVSDAVSLTRLEMAVAASAWAMAVCFFYWLWKKRPDSYAVEIVVVLLVALNVFLIFFVQWRAWVPQAIYRATPELAKVIASKEPDSSRYRVMGFLVGDGLFREVFSKGRLDNESAAVLQREFMVNNSTMLWNIPRMDGMDPYRSLRSHQMLNTVVAGENSQFIFDPAKLAEIGELDRLDNRRAMKPVSLPEKIEDFRQKIPLLSMMNVKYVYSPYVVDDRRLAPIPIESGSLPVVPRLYENRSVLPRIYFAATAQFFSGNYKDLLAEMNAAESFAEKTWIECASCPEPPAAAGKRTIEVLSYRDGSIAAEVDAGGGGWLVLSEQFFPGWTASIDGEYASLYHANYLFQAVWVPKGRHAVNFEYHDPWDLIFGQTPTLNMVERAKSIFKNLIMLYRKQMM